MPNSDTFTMGIFFMEIRKASLRCFVKKAVNRILKSYVKPLTGFNENHINLMSFFELKTIVKKLVEQFGNLGKS